MSVPIRSRRRYWASMADRMFLSGRVPGACIAETVLRDEGLAVPIGAFSHEHGLTLSLPGVIGRRGLRVFIRRRCQGMSENC